MRTRTIDVTELRRTRPEVVVHRPHRERLRASLGERAIAKQGDAAEAKRQRDRGR